MIPREAVYPIGRLGKTHGLRGEMTLFVDDDVFDRVDAEYVVLLIDGILVPFFIEEYRFVRDDRAIVKFCDVDDRATAEEYVNTLVFFPHALSDTDDREFTPTQLIGYTIYDSTTNTTLSAVESIDSATDNALFVLTDGRLIPLTQDWITDIDHDNRTIHMTLPIGLLSL